MRRAVAFTLTWTRLALAGVALILLGTAGALIVAWSGIYNIAASQGHPAFFESFLELGMHRSVAVNATAPGPTPDLSDPGRIRLGAAHYREGCAVCHGAPGDEPSPITRAMLPVPPRLEHLLDDWSDQELHWMLTHGIQYSGMPGWPGQDRPAEVWAVVAFLRALPEMDAPAYERASRGNAAPPSNDTDDLVNGTGASLALTTCAGCHSTTDAGPVSEDVPLLANQTEEYLRRALRAYQDGTRESGFMEPVAVELELPEIDALARYYADLPDRIHPVAGDVELQALLLGRQIAQQGLPAGNIPACNSCHGADARVSYPRLAGQSARYVEVQLQLWQRGGRRGSPEARTMAAIADRLSVEEIAAVAAYYSSISPDSANQVQAEGAP